MYVVTFYSFKGGVGRTLALVNVGYHLASNGRRVLLVDFDLEAPALDTFDRLEPRGKSRGVVDYFTRFCETNESPDVGDYLYEVIGAGGDGGRLWVMPAGLRDGQYEPRMRALDWRDMYENRDGFLAVEDLHEQWNRHVSPDYVLIDSRTGHCDVGGICTRQLPNAVVAVFFPSGQNVIGLKKVVTDIRKEKDSPRQGERKIHFVTSIIPRIDDEKGDLRDRMKECQSELGYVGDPLIIHHYDSLSFVNQVVFTVERSGTSLAQEYRKLALRITEGNLEDRNGARRLLHRILEEPTDSKAEREQLNDIATKHSDDGPILFLVALAHQRFASAADVLTHLDRAIGAGYKSADAFLLGADVRDRLRIDEPRIIQDVRSALDCDSIRIELARRAIQLLRQYDPSQLGEIGDRQSIRALSPDDKHRLAVDLLWDIGGARVAIELLFGALRDPDCDDELRQTIREVNLSLALIATGRFQDAMMHISTIRPQPEDLGIQGAFNYAMAAWAATGDPPISFFRRVVESDVSFTGLRGGNYHQCLALAHWAIDNKDEAMQQLASARRKGSIEEFSCWRYRKVTAAEFREDLAALERMIGGEAIIPLFMQRPAAEVQAQPSQPDSIEGPVS